MTSVPLGHGDWRRTVADEAEIPLLNRYFEANPANLADQVALLSRPGLRKWLEVGNGPIRAIYSQPGSFDDALFTISYDTLYRVDSDETITTIGAGFTGAGITSIPVMAATAEVGSLPAHLFIADGRNLWLYVENGYALGTLTGTPANNDTVTIGTTYYKWTSGSVNAGSPAGTFANPWLVALGAISTDAFTNIASAISGTGVAGTDYSTATTPHVSVQADVYNGSLVTVRAITAGTGGNSIATTETGAALAWNAATLTGGGGPTLTQVQVPDDVGVIAVGYIAGFVIVVVAQGYGINGRFYWIQPGETTIDPLDFATAERSPDPITSVRVVGDQFWLFGTNSTEIWFLSGDSNAPFQRVQARLFERGIWEGTDVQIKDSVVVVDGDGVVYVVAGGGPQRISTNSIEERIRRSMRRQELAP